MTEVLPAGRDQGKTIPVTALRNPPRTIFMAVTTADYVLRETQRAKAGVILSRKYSEMRLENLAAAGKAVRDAGNLGL
jgi:hypothetical protein